MELSRGVAFVGALVLALGGAVHASDSGLQAVLDGVHRETLDNGLTLLVSEQPGSGVVAINTWVKAGYFHEPDEVAGMAHLFEHMFFKGSKSFPEPEAIAGELARIGGRTNAGTIYDSTNYYFVLPKESFRRGLEIQADALIHPLFDPEELAKEAEVVIEESNRKLDNPSAVSLERMFATSFTEHRIRRWRIGSNEVLRNIDRDDLIAFFETLYRPENLILSIAGDVTTAEVSKAARETFGALERGVLKKERGPEEPEQKAFRFGHSSADLTQGYSVFGWHTPGVGSDDELALDLLAAILGQGRSSRLYREVVGPDGASTSSSGHWTVEDVGIFYVRSSFDEERRQEVDRRVLAEVERLREYGPTEYEVALARNQVESDIAFAFEDALGQARTLASYQARGDFGLLGEHVETLRGITPQQVRDVARRYLTLDRATLYHYLPNGVEASDREAQLALAIAAVSEVGGAPEAVEIPARTEPIRRASHETGVQMVTLDNGVDLIVEPRPGAPIVSTGIYFPGGRTAEHSGNAGITQLMGRTMLRGTSHRSGEEIDRQIEFLGTSIDRVTNADYFGFELDILSRNYAPGIELLADIVLHSTFPEDEFVEQRHLQEAAVKRSMDSSFQRPFSLLVGQLFGSHPYGLPGSGDSTSLASLDRDGLESFWRDHVVAEGAVIVVVGDVDPEAVRTLFESQFGALPKASQSERRLAPAVSPKSRIETAEYRDRKQSAIVVGYRTVPRTHEDWTALRLLGNVTSGLSGTFFAELRGRQSLAYTVFAGESTMAEAGYFFSYLATDADKEERARASLQHEILRLAGQGITDDDVERAKAYFAGSTRIAQQTNSSRARSHADHYFYGVGLDFLERTLAAVAELTADDLRAVSEKYLSHDHYVVATLKGKPDEPQEAPAGSGE